MVVVVGVGMGVGGSAVLKLMEVVELFDLP